MAKRINLLLILEVLQPSLQWKRKLFFKSLCWSDKLLSTELGNLGGYWGIHDHPTEWFLVVTGKLETKRIIWNKSRWRRNSLHSHVVLSHCPTSIHLRCVYFFYPAEDWSETRDTDFSYDRQVPTSNLIRKATQTSSQQLKPSFFFCVSIENTLKSPS